jgi:polyribonucleotide nucleotidyltransferase
MYSTSDDPAWQVKSRTLISDAKSWVSSLPTTEKVKFKQAAESFKHAFILYSIQVGAQMASGKVQNGFPIPEEAIKTAESFNQYQGLNRAWLKVQEDYKKYSELSNQLRPDQKKAVGTESKKQIQAKIEFMNLVGESMKHKTDQTFREIFG